MLAAISKFNLRFSREVMATIFAVILVAVFILFNSYVAQNIWLYLIFLLPAGLIIWRYPEAGIYLVVVGVIAFERLFTLEPIRFGETVIKFYPLDLILFFSLVGVLWQGMIERQFIWRDKIFSWALWVFFSLLAINFIRATLSSQVDLALAFSTFKNFALYFVVYLIMINAIRTPVQFQRLIATFVVSSVVLLGFVFYGLITGQGVWAEFVPLSTWGFRVLGGSHSFYVTLLIILFLNILLQRQKLTRRDAFYIILLFIFVFSLVASLARHLWLGLLLGLLVAIYFYQTSQRKKFTQLFGLGLLLIFFLILVSFWFYSWQANNFLLDSDILQAIKSRFLPVVSQGQMDSSTVWRLSSWSRAWELFKDNWWAGVGLGKMLTFEIADMEVTVEMRQLHNDFIALAVQLGIWGILVVIYLISSIIRAFLLYYRQINESYRLYFLTFFIWVLIFLWSANFGVYFDLNTLVIFFWLALGGMAVSQKLGSS